MSDILKVGGRLPGAGQRNIDLRLNTREALLVHRALRDKEATLRKEAWWLGEKKDQDGADVLTQEAQECDALADRIARNLDSTIGIKR